MKLPTPLASSPTLDGIRACIVRYYFGSTVTLTAAGINVWSVATGKGIQSSVRVRLIGKRYRFESIPTPEKS